MSQLRTCIHGHAIERDTFAWFKSLNWLDESVGPLPRGSSISDIDGVLTDDDVSRDLRFYDDAGRLLFIETKAPHEALSNGQMRAIRAIGGRPRCAYVILRGNSERAFAVDVVGLNGWTHGLRSSIPAHGTVDAELFAAAVRNWWGDDPASS